MLDTVMGSRLSQTSFGMTRVVSDFELDSLLQLDVLQGAKELLKVNQKLINTKNPLYRDLARAIGCVRMSWKRNTTPWVQPGVRVLKKSNYNKLQDDYQEAYSIFKDIREIFCTKSWPTLVEEAKKKWGKRFNPALYPMEMPTTSFDFQLEFPSLEGDPSLEAMDSKAYKKMKELAEQRLQESCALAEKGFAAGLHQILASLQNTLTPEFTASGDLIQKKYPTKTLNALEEAYKSFKSLAVTDHHELDILFNRVFDLTKGVDFRDLKTNVEAAKEVKDQLATIATTLHVATGEPPPKRKITKQKVEPSSVPNHCETVP